MGAVAGIGASLLGGVMQSNAASDAADAQAAAAREQLALQKDIYDKTSANYAPWLNGGTTANAAVLYELGLGPKPTIGGTPAQISVINGGGAGQSPVSNSLAGPGFPELPYNAQTGARVGNNSDNWTDGDQMRWEMQRMNTQSGPAATSYSVNGQNFATMEEAQAYANANTTGGTEYQGYQKTPGYDFQLSQGMDALQSTAAARGNLLSGATMKSAQTFGQDLADQDYSTYFNRLAGVSGQGQAAAGNQAAAGANYAANAGNALAGIGNAQAAGSIGSANAWSGAMNNILGTVGYMQGGTSTGANSPLSLGSWKFGAI